VRDRRAIVRNPCTGRCSPARDRDQTSSTLTVPTYVAAVQAFLEDERRGEGFEPSRDLTAPNGFRDLHASDSRWRSRSDSPRGPRPSRVVDNGEPRRPRTTRRGQAVGAGATGAPGTAGLSIGPARERRRANVGVRKPTHHPYPFEVVVLERCTGRADVRADLLGRGGHAAFQPNRRCPRGSDRLLGSRRSAASGAARSPYKLRGPEQCAFLRSLSRGFRFARGWSDIRVRRGWPQREREAFGTASGLIELA
jgi:hypothetical protein